MNRKTTVVICCGVLAVTFVSLWRWSQSTVVRVPQAETIGIQTGLGQVLAEETAKVAPAHGRVVVFTAFTPTQLKERSNHLWHAFVSDLQKHSLSITATESVIVNAWNSGSLAADRAAFKELLERHANVDVLVFLVDLPDWGQMAEVLSQSRSPKIIAIDNLRQQMKPRYDGYFSSGILAALIGPATGPVPLSQPKTPREWFDRYYQVYTPQNFESLPD